MKRIARLLLISLLMVLSLFAFAEQCLAQLDLIPYVLFRGSYTVGGALTLNAAVYQAKYEDNTTLLGNVADESIITAKVVLSGATRTGPYSFFGSLSNPDDVSFSIVHPIDGFVYFTSNLADSEFVLSGLYYTLNNGLNANDPFTLNLYNIVLNTDTTHPSRYIEQLKKYLAASNLSGMKMQLRIPSGAGNFTTSGSGQLTYGLIDGLQSLEVSDGQSGSSDDMVLTVQNSAPHAAPGAWSTYEINTDVFLDGDVSDFDGDWLDYKWLEGTNVICSGTIQASAGGERVELPVCVTSNLGLGIHIISLEVSDTINTPDKQDTVVTINDSSAPTIAPVASAYIMWPPNHLMVNIAIDAYAFDNSGLPVTLTVSVASNEPVDGLGDGDMGPDWITPVINQDTGRIDLQLRRERSGSGSGRVYTTTITATDSSGNASTAYVNITVPHDMAKKK
ncbi:MAG: hypothetical protein HZC49_04515 [Nitrospirae bacterium]|nr:hypothetical protein [Nitrospirota bacterium]